MALMHGDLGRLAVREMWLEWYLQRERKIGNEPLGGPHGPGTSAAS
jgi:hypothetical protein